EKLQLRRESLVPLGGSISDRRPSLQSLIGKPDDVGELDVLVGGRVLSGGESQKRVDLTSFGDAEFGQHSRNVLARLLVARQLRDDIGKSARSVFLKRLSKLSGTLAGDVRPTFQFFP